MDVKLCHGPGATCARVHLAAGETCTAEAGAMLAMSGHMGITTTTHKKNSGSLMKSVKRMMAGESFFLNHFEPKGQPGEVLFGTALPGDMAVYELNNETLIVQAGSFVVCEEGVDIDLGWQGFKTLFSGESLFWVKLSGTGKVVFNAFGAIYPIDVRGSHIVDTSHVVAFHESLTFSITKAGRSWLHSVLGGEGLVCRFEGQGTVWCQSHNPVGFGRALSSDLRPRRV